jgi:DNA-binding transcriptional LysR family regulator
MGSNPKGHLRVNASIWFGSLILAPIICDYLQQFPEVNIELSLTDRYVDIVDEGFNVAILLETLKIPLLWPGNYRCSNWQSAPRLIS